MINGKSSGSIAISVIVPVYKVEPYLRRCVDSILSQSYTDFELILVDDGSPDGCPAICDEYAARDSRVKVIHQQNGGLSAARNAGIDWAFANSDSRWIYFADSDDWIHPKSLEALYRAAEETGLPVVVGCAKAAWEMSPKVDEAKLTAEICHTEDFYCDYEYYSVIACGKLYRKECFADIRYPAGKIHEDTFTTYRILFRFPETAVIFQPLYAHFQHPESIIGHWDPNRLAVIEAMEGQVAYFREHGFLRAEKEARYRLVKQLSFQCAQIRKSNRQIRRQYLQIYSQKLIEAYAENRELMHFPKDRDAMLGCYEFRHPITGTVIHAMRSVLHAVKKCRKRD